MTDLLWQLERVYLPGGQRPRLADLTLAIEPGVTAILGYSGAGKTSLLNLLVGFEQPARGRIIATLPTNQARLPLYWVPQNDGLWPHLSVREHVALAARSAGVDASSAEQLLADFDLAARRDAYPAQLSGGERARLAVARALASGARVLVMDEPLVHVDPARAGRYWQAIRAHVTRAGASLVLATHSPERVLREAQRVVCLEEGRLLYQGSVEDLYWRPPSATLAAYLGEANWFDYEAAKVWLPPLPLRERSMSEANPVRGEPAGMVTSPLPGVLPSPPPSPSRGEGVCLRPQQVQLEPAGNGPLTVRAWAFAGSVAEACLYHEQAQQERTIFHRPGPTPLRPGQRVCLKLCLLLLALMTLVPGCGGSDEPTLSVRGVAYWSLPSAGTKAPAPRGLGNGHDDQVLVLDTAGRVLVFDGQGQVVRQWDMPDSKVGKPEGILLLKDGRIAVADTHYHRLVFFDQEGKVLSMQGEQGTGPGQFIYPVALAQDEQGNVYVSEYGSNDRVQKFSPEGKLLLAFGSFGTGPGQFQRPSGLVWCAGKVYVADAINNRIQVFSDQGTFLGELGGGGRAPSLHFPYALSLSKDGFLYAIEYGAGRVTKLGLDGRVHGRFGHSGTGEGEFSTPWGIVIDASGRLRVADTGNRRLVELRL